MYLSIVRDFSSPWSKPIFKQSTTTRNHVVLWAVAPPRPATIFVMRMKRLCGGRRGPTDDVIPANASPNPRMGEVGGISQAEGSWPDWECPRMLK